MRVTLQDETATKAAAERIGRQVHGGETIQLVGDVGAGKTTFVKGLARGLDIDGDIQSPSFTLNRTYEARDGLRLSHYDFYRLNEAGVVGDELAEDTADPTVVTVVEWADIVTGILPEDTMTIRFEATSETGRTINLPEGWL